MTNGALAAMAAELLAQHPGAMPAAKRKRGRPLKQGQQGAWMLFRELMLVLLFNEVRSLEGLSGVNARKRAAEVFCERCSPLRASATEVARAKAKYQGAGRDRSKIAVRRVAGPEVVWTDFDVAMLNEMQSHDDPPITLERIRAGTSLSFGPGGPTEAIRVAKKRRGTGLTFGRVDPKK